METDKLTAEDLRKAYAALLERRAKEDGVAKSQGPK
jgi:hypothetical protein